MKINKNNYGASYAGSVAVLVIFIILFSLLSFAFYGEEITGIVFTEHEELINPSPEEQEAGWWENIPFIGGIVSTLTTLWGYITLGFNVVATLLTFNVPSVPFWIRLLVVIPVWTLIIFIIFDLVTKAVGSVAGAVV